MRRPFGSSYAFVVIAVTFLALLVAAGLRAAPSVLMVPIEANFGWSRSLVSGTAALGIFLYGLVGPFAAALMMTLGIRRTMLGGLVLMAAATIGSLWMQAPWQYLLTWGLLSGIGSGAVANVLGAAMVNRWFASRQGLMMGMLTASTATGALVFLPLMAWLAEGGAWKPVALTVGLACLALVPLVLLLVPEHPRDIGTSRYGGAADEAGDLPPRGRPAFLAIDALRRASRRPVFWMLFGSFLICGLTTNGLVGTHLIAFCGDHGIPPVTAAGLLSLMGLFDLVGTTASGWLTDRYDPRRLLFVYYGIRGLSLAVLPFLPFDGTSLLVFAIFYGLDWVATVPPTVRLTYDEFGPVDGPVVFGWVAVGHQIGAAAAAFGAGLIRESLGSYAPAFFLAGVLGVGAALLVMTAGRGGGTRVPAAA